MRKKKTDELGDKLIPISRLHLDLTNFRHEPVASEAEAVTILCNEELVAELADDVVRRGALSPLDLLGVIQAEGNPGHFVAVEGNRRTCALIVLNDPNRAPEKLRAQLRRLSAKANHPSKVKVHVFSSRKDAKQWIDLRHLGEQGGVGTRTWNPTQKGRAVGDNNRTTARDNTLAISVLDRLEEVGLLSSEQRKKVPVSTITRYLSNPVVRAILGLQGRNELIYTHAADEVDEALCRFVLDSITPGSDGVCPVNSRASVIERTTYANMLKSEGVSPKTTLEQPSPPPSASSKKTSKHNAPGGKSKSARDPDTRRRLVPTDFPIGIDDSVLLRLRKEGLALDVEDFTFSANYILRAMVEHTMTLFLRKRGKWRENMADAALTQACASELKAIGVQGKALSLVEKAAGSQAQPYSLHSLGHVLHGGSIPIAKVVKRNFDSWRPSLEAMLEFLSKSSKK